ncbi:MAG: arsenic efflux protein [Clostridia bacterium]|nr:arsenic efflux protein [Clostridia bacterium]
MNFWETALDALIDSALDTLKVAPFLFLIYLAMEFIEHKAGDKTKELLARSGRVGPVLGGLFGCVPQCGFSAACSGLYAGGVITVGTLFAVFLSTSDEMLPIMISGGVPALTILKIVGTKALIGIVVGVVIDLILRPKTDVSHIHDLCEHGHCHCEHGIFRSALHHFVEIIIYIFLFSFAVDLAIGLIGEETISTLFINVPVVGSLISAAVGLIPNCAASVVITDLYVNGIISSGVMMSGLLVGAGIGLFVLFRSNKSKKQALVITGALYAVGVVVGVVIDLIGITF